MKFFLVAAFPWLALAGEWDVKEDDGGFYKIMVDDFDTTIDDHTVRGETIGGTFETKYFGMAYIEVTGSMTVGDLMDKVNYNRDDRWVYWEPRIQDINPFVLMHKRLDDWESMDVNTWKEYRHRPDLGRLFANQFKHRIEGRSSMMFVTAHFAGDVLNPRATLRSYGITAGSCVLLRRKVHADKVAELQEKTTTELGYLMFRGKQRDLSIDYYPEEPFVNVVNSIRAKLGIPTQIFEMKIEDDTNTIWKVVIDEFTNPLDFDEEDIPSSIKIAKDNLKGPVIAAWEVIKPEPPKNDDDKFIMSPRYPHWTTKPMKLLVDDGNFLPSTFKVSDPTASCKCATEHEYDAHIKPTLPAKLRARNFGMGCNPHDLPMKYCRGKKRVKGDRDCWCPLQWCYVSPHCGLSSKQFPTLFYSYDYCDNGGNSLDCYTADDEGYILETNIFDPAVYNFPQLRNYLSELVAKLVEAMPGFGNN